MPDQDQGLPTGYLSLATAAERAGRSVRTVHRWIKEGLVDSMEHPTDRRQRLVSQVSLDARIGLPANTHREWIEESHQRIGVAGDAIADLVRSVDHHASFVSAELGEPRATLAPEELIHAPLAHELLLLVAAVHGKASPPPDEIAATLQRVLRTLHTDPVMGEVRVPDDFWRESLIGRYLARARLLLFPPSRLVNLNEIVEQVGLPRNRVENILRALQSDRIYDPDDERWLYPRETIDAIRTWSPSRRSRRTYISDVGGVIRGDQRAGMRMAGQMKLIEDRRRIRSARNAYHHTHFPEVLPPGS